MLKADVADFYPTVYTHAVEWALHGKAASKARLGQKNHQKTFGAELDAAVRSGQDGQTKGLPIGPDTSLVIAEAIMCAVDEELQQEFRDIGRYATRWFDDLMVFTSSQSEAEEIVLRWQSILLKYDLMVSTRKTSIFEGPPRLEAPWKVSLAQFILRADSDRKLQNDFYHFFSLAFALAEQYPEAAVMNFALRKATAARIGKESGKTLGRMALSSAISDASSLRYVYDALEKISNYDDGIIAELPLVESLNEACEYHAAREHGTETAWALYTAARFRIRLEESATNSVCRMDDCCSLILIAHLDDEGLLATSPDLSSAMQRSEFPEAWKSEDWLLAYEMARTGKSRPDVFTSVSGWKDLLAADVKFFILPQRRPSRAHGDGGSISSPEPSSDDCTTSTDGASSESADATPTEGEAPSGEGETPVESGSEV